MARKLLIVNADDFGMHEDLNEGIIGAFEGGVVRSASLLVNMPASAHAVRLARAHPGLEVGIHLNISSQTCVAAPHEVPLLVDAQAQFLFDGRDLPRAMRWLRGLIDQIPAALDQIAIEFACQIEWFRATGLRLGHLNIHHYLALVHPRLFDVYVRTAERAGVPCRGLCYPMLTLLRTPASEIETMAALLGAACVPAPSLSISNLLDGLPERVSADLYQRRVEARLADLARDDTVSAVEIVAHPAVISEVVRQKDSYLWARELESALTISPSFAGAVDRLGYHLGGYASLRSIAPPQ